MPFVTFVYVSALVLSLSLMTFMVWRVVWSYVRFRGKRLVPCPETGEEAAVEVDAKSVAFATAIVAPSLRLADCSRWPERGDCEQECLVDIDGFPYDRPARSIVADRHESD